MLIKNNLGIMTAAVTPMREDGVTVNENALKAIIEYQIENGAGSLLFLGGTGETPSVPAEARKKILEIAAETVDHRVPVVAGVYELSIFAAIREAKTAKAAGADILLAAPPFARGTDREGCISFYKKIEEAAGLPILIYNYPDRFGDNGYCCDPADVEALMDAVPLIVGIKECCMKFDRTAEMLCRFGDRIQILSGNEAYAPWEMLAGARGAVLAGSNVLMKEYAEIYDAAMAGDAAKTTALAFRIQSFQRLLFQSPNPGPVKYALTEMGFEAGGPLPPVAPVPAALKEKIRAGMVALGILQI